MAANRKSQNPGVCITITAGAAVTSGQIVQVGPNLAGVAQSTVASGEQVAVDIFGGIYTLPATAAEDVAAGTHMYVDDSVVEAAAGVGALTSASLEAANDYPFGVSVGAQDGTSDLVDVLVTGGGLLAV